MFYGGLGIRVEVGAKTSKGLPQKKNKNFPFFSPLFMLLECGSHSNLHGNNGIDGIGSFLWL